MTSRPPDATVVIPTYNRARLLDETLQSLRGIRLRGARTWNAIVVDNNSSDDTRATVERHARDFPVPLRYLFEARQGRSSALLTGSCAVRDSVETAGVLAVLDATNRWVEAGGSAVISG